MHLRQTPVSWCPHDINIRGDEAMRTIDSVRRWGAACRQRQRTQVSRRDRPAPCQRGFGERRGSPQERHQARAFQLRRIRWAACRWVAAGSVDDVERSSSAASVLLGIAPKSLEQPVYAASRMSQLRKSSFDW